MAEKLIPLDVQRAALRGFLRTGAQSLATAFAAVTGFTVVLTSEWVLSVLLGAAGALVFAAINGAQSYFSILSKGIPEDYASVGPVEESEGGIG